MLIPLFTIYGDPEREGAARTNEERNERRTASLKNTKRRASWKAERVERVDSIASSL
jgi:hypothetical protein